jgi:hypothetical protein
MFASPASLSIVTLLSVAVVFIIYFLRRRDYKRDAANIILLELKNSVERLNEARKTYKNGQAQNPPYISFPDRLRLMPTASWTKYKYLFVRSLEPEQWRMISDYYDNCHEFDAALEHRDSAFNLNEEKIRVGIQQNISEIAMATAKKLKPNPNADPAIRAENEKLENEAKVLCDEATRLNITKLVYIYNPDKSFRDAKYYFDLLPENVVETPTGQKIKRLAGVSRKK